MVHLKKRLETVANGAELYFRFLMADSGSVSEKSIQTFFYKWEDEHGPEMSRAARAIAGVAYQDTL